MSTFKPSALRAAQRPTPAPHGRCYLGTAASHRDPAPYVAQPQVSAEAAAMIGKGDREIEEARRKLMSPFEVDTPAPQAKPESPSLRMPFKAVVLAKQAQAVQKVQPQGVTIHVPISERARKASPDWNTGGDQ